MREQRQKCHYSSSVGVESRTSTVVESKTRSTSKVNFVLDSTTLLNFRVPDSTTSSKIACLCTVMYYFCFNLSLIESYLDYQYTPVYSLFSAQLITVPVYTAFKCRTKANITTKRRRSFAFAFECRRSSRRTNN